MKSIDELKQRLAASEKHLQGLQREQAKTHDRLREAEAGIPEIEAKIGALREQRQNYLADGKSCTEVNKLIRSAGDDLELLQDEIIGLAAKARRLSEEIPHTHYETMTIKRAIAVEQARPAVERYNILAEEFSKAVVDLQRASIEYDRFLRTSGEPPLLQQPFPGDGSWPIRVIPRFTLIGDNQLLPVAYDSDVSGAKIADEVRRKK